MAFARNGDCSLRVSSCSPSWSCIQNAKDNKVMTDYGHGGKAGPTAIVSEEPVQERVRTLPPDVSTTVLGRVLSPDFRPFLIFIVALGGLTLVDAGEGRILSSVTAFSTLQYFSTFGLVAL